MLARRSICVGTQCRALYLHTRFYSDPPPPPPPRRRRVITDDSPLPVFPHVPKPYVDPYRILFETYYDVKQEEVMQKVMKYHPLKFDLSKAIPSEAPPLLAREYMYDSLYNKTYGYFSAKEDVINPDCKIKFTELLNKDDYYYTLKEMYDSGPKSAWLTPVEIFNPWYGYALANYIQQTHAKFPPGTPLKIFEMGAGLGTCADSILTYLQKHFPDLYKNTSYTIIEISPTLARKQKERLAHHAQTGSERVQIKRASIFDWTETVDDECFVIGMEVLDNFPHDKIARYGGDGGWFEAIVRQNTNGTYYEDYRPVSDALISDYLAFTKPSILQTISDTLHSFFTRFQTTDIALRAPHQITYIPTMAFWFVQILHSCFPRHHLILADFSHLPSLSEGEQAPVVQQKTGAKTREYSHYLVPQKGTCDIFFPTNFRKLEQLYHTVAAHIKPNEQTTNPQNSHTTNSPTTTSWCTNSQSTNSQSTNSQSTNPQSANSQSINSQSINSQPANSQPANSQPTNSQPTNSQSTNLQSTNSQSTPATITNEKRVYKTRILSNRNFMKQYGNLEQTTTKSGFNPLLEDYVNMHFFVSTKS